MLGRKEYEEIVKQTRGAFLTIDLNYLISGLFGLQFPSEYDEQTSEESTQREKQILKILSEPNLREVYIKYKDGQMHRLDSIKRLDGTKKLVEYLELVRTGKLNVQKNNGKIQFVEITDSFHL